MQKITVFTIASKNYLGYVRVLLKSVAELHPEYDLYLCLADQVDGYFEPSSEPYKIIQADQIGIPTFHDMALRYDIMEFNTAIKPFVFQWLFKTTNVDAVVYLDPDICAYSRFDQLEEILARGASVVLTPHITRPLEDGKIPNDYNMLQSGVFNLGFIAARRSVEALDFLGWWSRRLATQAIADFKSNLFTDQRWCDLAPCFVDKLHILKDPGYNVAYWNLAHQKIWKNKVGIWHANDAPLAFFHFSGVSADKGNVISKYQDRFLWEDLPNCRSLFDNYTCALLKSGWNKTRNWPYAYGQTSDGFVITPLVRQLFRRIYPEPVVIDPSSVAGFLARLCNEPAPDITSLEGGTITRLMHVIYSQRDDLQGTFNLSTLEGQRQFISWFSEAGPREYGLSSSIARPRDGDVEISDEISKQRSIAAQSATNESADELTRLPETSTGEGTSSVSEVNERKTPEMSVLNDSKVYISTLRNINEVLALSNEDFVTCIYRALLGRFPDPQGRAYYVDRLNSGVDKLEVIGQIYKSPEARRIQANDPKIRISLSLRVFFRLPRVIRKLLGGFWSNRIAYDLPKNASFNANSTVDVRQRAPVRTVSKLDNFDRPANLPQLLGDQFISNLMYLIWQSRPDLQKAFDLTTDLGQKNFAVWYQASAHREYGLEPRVPIHSDLKSTESSNQSSAVEGTAGANLIGYAHAELGMGEHVRMTASALQSTNIDFKVVNFNVGVASRQKAALEHGEIIDGNPYKANIFHINADAMLLAFCHLGRNFFYQRYNIGYWAWELSKCPEDWMHALGMMDEIWAPSRFIQESFLTRAKIPVQYMPLCVTLPPLKGYARKHFGIPQKVFAFLYTFDFFSYLDRKNPFAAILAFKLAFANKKQSAVLVLKTMNADKTSPLWSKMMDIIDGDPRIIVIDKTIDRDEIIGLFDVCDCFVSLHRSEGFGRGPAEAMYLGKPVIVTNYSGNTDFTLPDNSCLVDYKLIPVEAGQYPFYEDQVWADPDVEHASWFMKKVFEDTVFSRNIGRRGREFVQKNFNQNVIGALYAQRLSELGLG